MLEDGWWWHTPELTAKAIQRQLLRKCCEPDSLLLGGKNEYPTASQTFQGR